MAIIYHLLDSSGKLEPYMKLLEGQIELCILSVSQHLSLDADVCINHSPAHCNPVLGVGGGAFSPNLMHINLDADHENIERAIREELLPVLAHEAHHCKRIAAIPDDYSLIDSMVTEGLACRFELEVAGGDKPSFIPDSVMANTGNILSTMSPDLEETDFCYDTYFLGKDTSIFPKYAGFAVGFDVVGRFLESEGLSAAQSASIPASEILSYAKVG